MTTAPQTLVDQGKQAFAAQKYEQAAEFFTQAATAYGTLGDSMNAAEMRNNLSVALLKAGQVQAALDAAVGTDQVFASGGDMKNQAKALGNQAAALEGLKQFDRALDAYERSAALFAEVGDGEMRSIVLQSVAALKLRRGQVTDSAISMIGSVESAPEPTLLQRLLRFLLRLKP